MWDQDVELGTGDLPRACTWPKLELMSAGAYGMFLDTVLYVVGLVQPYHREAEVAGLFGHMTGIKWATHFCVTPSGLPAKWVGEFCLAGNEWAGLFPSPSSGEKL